MKTLASICKGFICIVLCMSLSACLLKPYRFNLEQGNIVTAEKIEQIHTGMSEEQVHHALGSPMLRDVFHTHRWDYVYYDRPNKGEVVRRHVAIYFEHGRVARISHESIDEPLPPVKKK